MFKKHAKLGVQCFKSKIYTKMYIFLQISVLNLTTIILYFMIQNPKYKNIQYEQKICI